MNKALMLMGLTHAYDIMKDCGAVPREGDIASLEDTQLNAKAIMKCIDMANNDPKDRTVVVPEGHLFSSMPVWASNLNDVTLTIDGVLETSPHIDNWTLNDAGDRTRQFIEISDSTNFNINGKGIVEGQGYDWWVREWNLQNHYNRPNLL